MGWIKYLMVLSLLLIACAKVPDSVKIAVQKEGEAIDKVAMDYQISVEAYHYELLNQVDQRLDDIYRYEIEKLSASGKLTAENVIELDNKRAEQRRTLYKQMNEVKNRLLNSKNLQILKALHEMIYLYIQSDRFTAEDFVNLLRNVEPMIHQIKSGAQIQGATQSDQN